MAAYTALSDNLDQLQLETGDDSMEVQVPDFHFDWGVDKEPQPPRPASGLRTLTLGRTRSHQTPSPQATVSAHSSASSGHVLGLTDASTASGSSLVPTPPQGATLGSGFSPTGRPTSARRFQRVVSAPIARPAQAREEEEEVSLGLEARRADAQRSITATMRPQLNHTSSGTGASMTLTGSRTASAYATPGVLERSMVGSTTRRVGGLSRFGGPARRVVAPLEETETRTRESRGGKKPVLMQRHRRRH